MSNPRSSMHQYHVDKNGTGGGGGAELQNSPFFKSRYFEAAAQSGNRQPELPDVPNVNSSASLDKGGATPKGPSSASRQGSMTPSMFFEQQMEIPTEMVEPMEDPGVIPSASSAGTSLRRGSYSQYPRPNSTVGATSYASTPRITNQQESVVDLLAKIQSVNRADPSAALREIDAILKSGGTTMGASREAPVPVTAHAPPAPEAVNPQATDPEEDNGDSETETTVSSITNPTFSGHQSRRHRKREEKRQQPTLPTMQEGEASNARAPVKQAAEGSSRRKKDRSPPPETIQVSGARDRSHREHGHKEMQKRPVNLDEVRDHLPLDSAAELAEKIRRWDELSGKGSAPETKNTDFVSDTTDALGSIVTPSDGMPKKKLHPWDNIPTLLGQVGYRDMATDSGSGAESRSTSDSTKRRTVRQAINERRREEDERNRPFVDESNNPFAQESDHESSRASPSRESSRYNVPERTVNNMSNEFDDAWVTLPTSNFFASETPVRGSMERSTEGAMRDEIPPTLPASSKNASVQKFSPERLDPVTREMDYEPVSPRRRTREMEGTTAYDEKPVEQARSDEKEEDGIEVTLVGTRKEPKKKGLRALLQRRSSKGSFPTAARSVVSSNSGRRAPMGVQDVEIDPPRSASRGRGRFVSPARNRDRAHSLEERTNSRNPNIARKFSRLLRVYADDDKSPAEC